MNRKSKICPLSMSRASGPNNMAVPSICQADSCMFWYDSCLVRELLIKKTKNVEEKFYGV